MNWSKGNILKKIGLEPREYVDMLLSMVFNKPVFDLSKFDEWLCKEYPMDKDKSIEEIINKHFPNIATELKDLFLI